MQIPLAAERPSKTVRAKRRTKTEDPVLIEVWGEIVPAKQEEATNFIRAHAVFRSEMELRKAVMVCVRKASRIQLAPASGYHAAQQLASAVEGFFDEVTYTQEFEVRGDVFRIWGYMPKSYEDFPPV